MNEFVEVGYGKRRCGSYAAQETKRSPRFLRGFARSSSSLGLHRHTSHKSASPKCRVFDKSPGQILGMCRVMQTKGFDSVIGDGVPWHRGHCLGFQFM